MDGAEILIFCVKEFYRGVGIGNRLIKAAVKLCNDNKISSICTTTHNNRLTDFYIKTMLVR